MKNGGHLRAGKNRLSAPPVTIPSYCGELAPSFGISVPPPTVGELLRRDDPLPCQLRNNQAGNFISHRSRGSRIDCFSRGGPHQMARRRRCPYVDLVTHHSFRVAVSPLLHLPIDRVVRLSPGAIAYFRHSHHVSRDVVR